MLWKELWNKEPKRIGVASSSRPVGLQKPPRNVSPLKLALIGFQSRELIVSAGLSLGDVDQYPTIDVTIDGADE